MIDVTKTPPKPGFKTTEFWLCLIAIAVGLVLVLTDRLATADYWPWLAGLSGAYAVARGLAKK